MIIAVPAGAVPPPAPQIMVSTSLIDIGKVSLGEFNLTPGIITLTNTGNTADTLTPPDIVVSGANPNDFFVIPNNDPDDQNNCTFNDQGDVVTIPAAGTCDLFVGFFPGATGPRSAVFTISSEPAGSSASFTVLGTGTEGYYEATSTGAVDTFGDAQFFGDTSASRLKAPIVGMQQTGDGFGYWLVGSDGGVFAFGDAPFFGGTGSIVLNQPIVGMAETADGGGYWLVASDGGIFAFGDAPFYGSTGAITLNKPIVGMAVTPDGGGYWLVASDGGIFAFGDAQFFGSTGAIHLNRPIVAMATSPTGGGYWMIASDGGIFAFGDAQFLGSAGSSGITNAVSMAESGSYTLQAILDSPAVRTHQRELAAVRRAWHVSGGG